MTASGALAAAAAAADSAASSSKSTTETDMAFVGLSTGVLVFLAAVWSLFGHFISARSRYLNESGTACLLGLLAGVALLAGSTRDTAGLVAELLSFNSASFFTYLLPPVIFYAGLSVEQRLFFSNLPSILSFGVLGTLVSFVLISAALYSLAGTTFGLGAQDCLALGAVFAATDSVAVLGLLDPRSVPQLFSLVFGEGIVNDATSVLLLGALTRVAMQSRASGEDDDAESWLELAWSLTGNFAYLLLTSTCLGLAAGIGVAVLLRARVASQGPHQEMALVGLLSYLAYLGAEVLGLSGILSLFCCGAAVSRFALRGGGSGGGAAAELTSPAHHGHRGGDLGLSPEPSLSGVLRDGRASLDSAGGAGDAAAAGDANGHWLYGSDDTPRAADTEVRRLEVAGGGGNGGGGRDGVLAGLATPAKRLVARAFNGPGGGGVMSAEGAAATLNAFHSLSYICEGLIFVYLGMDCLDPVRWKASYAAEVIWLVGVLLLFLMAARAASVVPLSMLHNLYAPRHQRLSGRDMLVIWWSGLMRGAVSVALVYLNFDTGEGSTPTEPVIVPRRPLDGVGLDEAAAPLASPPPPILRHRRPRPPSNGHRHRLRLLDVGLALDPTTAAAGAAATVAAAAESLAGAVSEAAAEGGGMADVTDLGLDVGAGVLGDGAASAASVAAAMAEADIDSARQHATLIVSTLMVVVASVLVVSTLTKPLLQAALEADPRKPPLKVLREALFDPWVEATWRFKLAVDRSYRRLMETTGGGATSSAGTGAGGDGPVVRRGGVAASALALITTHTTHTVPMSSTGGSTGSSGRTGGAAAHGSSGADEAMRRIAASAVASVVPKGNGSTPAVAMVTATGHVPDTAPAAADDSDVLMLTATSGRPRGQLQQRTSAAPAAASGAAAGPPPAPGPPPSPSAANLAGLGLPPLYEGGRGQGERPRLRLASTAATGGRRGAPAAGRGDASSGPEDGDSDTGGGAGTGGRRRSGSLG